MSDREDPPPEEGLGAGAAEDVRVVAKGGAVQVVGQLSQYGLAFLFAAMFLRLLGKAAFGLYRQVAQVLIVAGQIGLLGFNYAAMRFIARSRATGRPQGVRGAARVGIAGALTASAAVVAALVLFSAPIAGFFADSAAGKRELASLIRLGAAYVPLFALMQVLRYCTQAYKTMVPSVIVGNIVQPTARFLLAAAVLVTFGVAGAVSAMVISTGIAAFAAGFYYFRMLTEEERSARPAAETKSMIRFALPQAGASLLGVQTLGLGILILGHYGTDADVGLFAIGLALQGPGTVFLGGIVNIWAPVVSDLHGRNEMARLGLLYKTINRWIATFAFPVFAALIIHPDLFARLFAGRAAAGAGAIIAVLAIGNVFYTGTGPTGYLLSMTGRPGVNFVNSILAVSLYIVLGAIVVPRHGALGMAFVDAGVTALVNCVRVAEAYKLVGIQPFGRSFLKPVGATLASAAVLVGTKAVLGPGGGREAAGLALAAIVYVVVLLAMGIDREERYVWESIKKRVFKRPARKK